MNRPTEAQLQLQTSDSPAPEDPSSSSSLDADLSRQQKNLLLTRPLAELEAKKNLIGGEAKLLKNLDTSYLALSALQSMMEGSAMSIGQTREEVLDHLIPTIVRMDCTLGPDQAQDAATLIVDAIDNRSDNYQLFAYDYFDAKTGTTKTHRFSLVALDPDPDSDDRYCYRPTSEGYLLYLGMLDLAVEDAQELVAKLLQMMLEQGKFDQALDAARQARLLSIQHRQQIRELIQQSIRSPGSIAWSQDIEPRLQNARAHVAKRQLEDERMLNSVKENLSVAIDERTRHSLATIHKVLEEAIRLRVQLCDDAVHAHERYLEAQTARFRRRTSTLLPNLEMTVMAKAMMLPDSSGGKFAEEVATALYPADNPRIYELGQLLAMCLDERKAAPEADSEPDDEALHQIVGLEAVYGVELVSAMKARLECHLLALKKRETTSIARIVVDAVQDGLREEEVVCLHLLALVLFGDNLTMFQDITMTVDGRATSAYVESANVVFKRNEV